MNFLPRRKLVVNREIQYDILMYLGVFVGIVFLMQVLVGWLMIAKVEELAHQGDFSNMTVLEFIQRYKVSLFVFEAIPVALCLTVGFRFFNRLTSRIVGPIYNIKRSLRRAQEEGEKPSEIRLRETDYFQDLAGDINQLIRKDEPSPSKPKKAS